MCAPLKILGNVMAKSQRPMGPTRVTSINPSAVSAKGAIISLPPVNRLFENVR